jgi:hypothetical protein
MGVGGGSASLAASEAACFMRVEGSVILCLVRECIVYSVCGFALSIH